MCAFQEHILCTRKNVKIGTSQVAKHWQPAVRILVGFMRALSARKFIPMYVTRKIEEMKALDPAMKSRRQDPSSNYKLKYLSPASKKLRYAKLREQRKGLQNRIRKVYKKTKVQVTEDQSFELCQLIEEVEGSVS